MSPTVVMSEELPAKENSKPLWLRGSWGVLGDKNSVISTIDRFRFPQQGSFTFQLIDPRKLDDCPWLRIRLNQVPVMTPKSITLQVRRTVNPSTSKDDDEELMFTLHLPFYQQEIFLVSAHDPRETFYLNTQDACSMEDPVTVRHLMEFRFLLRTLCLNNRSSFEISWLDLVKDGTSRLCPYSEGVPLTITGTMKMVDGKGTEWTTRDVTSLDQICLNELESVSFDLPSESSSSSVSPVLVFRWDISDTKKEFRTVLPFFDALYLVDALVATGLFYRDKQFSFRRYREWVSNLGNKPWYWKYYESTDQFTSVDLCLRCLQDQRYTFCYYHLAPAHSDPRLEFLVDTAGEMHPLVLGHPELIDLLENFNACSLRDALLDPSFHLSCAENDHILNLPSNGPLMTWIRNHPEHAPRRQLTWDSTGKQFLDYQGRLGVSPNIITKNWMLTTHRDSLTPITPHPPFASHDRIFVTEEEKLKFWCAVFKSTWENKKALWLPVPPSVSEDEQCVFSLPRESHFMLAIRCDQIDTQSIDECVPSSDHPWVLRFLSPSKEWSFKKFIYPFPGSSDQDRARVLRQLRGTLMHLRLTSQDRLRVKEAGDTKVIVYRSCYVFFSHASDVVHVSSLQETGRVVSEDLWCDTLFLQFESVSPLLTTYATVASP